jgi:hypothetical protein
MLSSALALGDEIMRTAGTLCKPKSRVNRIIKSIPAPFRHEERFAQCLSSIRGSLGTICNTTLICHNTSAGHSEYEIDNVENDVVGRSGTPVENSGPTGLQCIISTLSRLPSIPTAPKDFFSRYMVVCDSLTITAPGVVSFIVGIARLRGDASTQEGTGTRATIRDG